MRFFHCRILRAEKVMQQNTNSVSTKAAIAFSMAVFFGFFLFLAWLVYLNYENKEKLISSGVAATAVIVGKACDDHGAIRYSFKVDGVEHIRKGYGCTPSCRSANIGETIAISYLPSNPSVNECGSPHAAASNALSWYVPLSILVIGFSFFCVKLLGRSKPGSM